jgi:GT2 family glycosyltransferase
LSHDTLTDGDRGAIRARLERFGHRPLISVVMPVYDPPIGFLRDAVASVQRQLYPHWELCIADDASPDPAVRRFLRDLAAREPRVRLVERDTNGHISAASNSALALASGAFVALMDHDDVLAEHALFEVAAALDADPDIDVIYSDEDHVDAHGRRHTPYFKPDFDPDLMLGHNLVNHLGVYRRSLVERIGGFRLGFEGSQDYDLALRAVEDAGAARVHHIPAVLYHWRSGTGADTFSEAAMERCVASARRAIADHLARTGQAGTVVAHPAVPSWHRVLRPRPAPAPLVSVIVPTKDGADLLRACAAGVLHRTSYPALELIVVDHQSRAPDALALMAELGRDPRVRVLPHAGPFNYSAINNAAVREARGSVLALLNNDVEVIGPDWLDEMVAQAVRPGVGAVGAKLVYPDERVQHGGVVLGPGGVAGHLSHGLHASDPGYCGRAALTATVSAVTAACLVVRRSVFEQAGGFDAVNLPVAFNDVDLCLKIRALGYRNLFAPHALLIHRESVSRGDDLTGAKLDRFRGEVAFMQNKWGELLDADPAYNPNLDLGRADFSLASPPRRKKPWKTQN